MAAQPHPPTPSSSPNPIFDDTEAAVQGLLTSWRRRQRWQHLLRCFRPSDANEAALLQNRTPWRARLAGLLESNAAHVVTITLLLVDLALTIHDLSSSLVSCSGGGGGGERKEVTRWVGVGILGLLAVRTAALLVALGWSFFRRPGRVVDGAVVAVALLLEVLAREEEGGLLVVVSLWRLVKVVESAFELSDETIQGKIERVMSQFEGLKEENKRLEEEAKAMQKRIAELEPTLSPP